jgi:hypothetical protein
MDLRVAADIVARARREREERTLLNAAHRYRPRSCGRDTGIIMLAMNRSTAAMTLQRIFEIIVKEFDRDCAVNQPYAFVRIASGGEGGLDQAKLQNDLALSSAGISRLVQALCSSWDRAQSQDFQNSWQDS